MIESTLKIAKYCPLVIQGFSNFLGLFQGIMANPGYAYIDCSQFACLFHCRNFNIQKELGVFWGRIFKLGHLATRCFLQTLGIQVKSLVSQHLHGWWLVLPYKLGTGRAKCQATVNQPLTDTSVRHISHCETKQGGYHLPHKNVTAYMF